MAAAKTTVADVIRVIEDFAPLGLAEDWDNVGLQIGQMDAPCRHVAVALDLTLATLEASLAAEADLILTHHPLLFRSLKSIQYDEPQGHLIQRICEAKVSVYAAHTNLDSTVGGLNDWLADLIDLQERTTLLPPPKSTPSSLLDKLVGLGRVGQLKKPGTLNHLAKHLRSNLDPESMRMIGHEHQEVSKVALCTGSGGTLMKEAIASGADCYITGDVKYHQALDAEAAGMAVLDVGHFASEIASIEILQSMLNKRLGPQIRIEPIRVAMDPIRTY